MLFLSIEGSEAPETLNFKSDKNRRRSGVCSGNERTACCLQFKPNIVKYKAALLITGYRTNLILFSEETQ